MTVAIAFITLAVCLVGFKTARHADQPDALYQGRSAFQWHRVAVLRRVERDRARNVAGRAIREARRFRRFYLHRADVVEAIRLGARAYDVDFGKLYRRAACESVLSPTAKNPSSTASGLFQFLTSTWASTPYARESIWSPYASALAAAWMERVGRGGEWVCRG
jgi:hypothetical protein